MSHPNLLVVGAAGHLGTRLVRRLLAAGVRARALVRTQEKAEAISPLATPIFGDLLLPETLSEAFRGAERVFIVAPGVPEMETLERNAIDAALAAGASRIVYLSNFTAKEGRSLMPMHVHGLHERYVASQDVEWTVLAPTRYMSSLPFNWTSVLQDGVLRESGGSGLMTCIDPEDVAEVAVMALLEDAHVGQTYRMTSEDAFTADALAALLAGVVGREIRVSSSDAHPPPMAAYFQLVAEGAYYMTDTAAEVLGRPPRSYAQWLAENMSVVRRGRP